MSIFRWEEPPPDGRSRSRAVALDHVAVAACLRRHPGRWALVAAGDVSGAVAHDIQSGRLAPYRPGGSFEAARRTVGGVVRIYARYVGGVSEVPVPLEGGRR